MSSPSPVTRISAVPHTARGPGERHPGRLVRVVEGGPLRSPRLNAQQVIFWPTAQTVQNLPAASPGASPRQISHGGDPLRFLGSGYPPRQVLSARKGADGTVEDAVSSYIPSEVFGPPKVISRSVAQDPKRSNPILRSFSGVAKEVAESPRATTASSSGAEARAPSAAASPAVPPLGTPIATAPVVASPPPVAKAAMHQEPMRLRWPVGSSTPTLSTPSVLVWHGYGAGRPTVVASPKLQSRNVATVEASLGSPVSDVKDAPKEADPQEAEPKEGGQEGSKESNDTKESKETKGNNGSVVRLEARPSGTFSTGTPIQAPREIAERFLAGTFTPPHFQMFRSTSTQPEIRPTSPHGRLGVTVRTVSPQTRGTGGTLISPSPLSFSSRQPPVPRRSGSPLSSKAMADIQAPVSSPMTRQRTLPGNLQPERSSTKILTAPYAPSLEVQSSRSSVAPELTSDKPPARAVGEGRASEIRRRWRRPSNPAIPHPPTEAPGTSHHDGNDFTPAVMRLQEKLGFLAEEGTVSL